MKEKSEWKTNTCVNVFVYNSIPADECENVYFSTLRLKKRYREAHKIKVQLVSNVSSCGIGSMGLGTVSKTEKLWFELAKIRSTNCVCDWAIEWHRRQHSVVATANGTYSSTHMRHGAYVRRKKRMFCFLYFNYRTIELPHSWRYRWNFECQQPACVFVPLAPFCCFS